MGPEPFDESKWCETGKPSSRPSSNPIAPTITTRLASRPDAHAATNPYRVWIAEYAGAAYQEVAAKARAHLDGLADLYATPAREAEQIAIFGSNIPKFKESHVQTGHEALCLRNAGLCARWLALGNPECQFQTKTKPRRTP